MTDEYTLSVVQLCPDAHRAAANAAAEAAGYGPNNLSVPLVDAQGAGWWGCHAWWKPEALAEADALTAQVPALAAVVTSVREGGEAIAHWQDALAAQGLSVVESGND